MSSKDTQPDGGIAKEDIFGSGEATARVRTPMVVRLRRMFDIWVRAPFLVAWTDWRTRIGGVGILLYILVGTLGVVVVPEPDIQVAPRYYPAFQDLSVPLGTDNLGRSVAHQLVHATPAMLQMALAGVAFVMGLGTVTGLIAGYKGGIVDRLLMTLSDIFIVLPALPLIIVIAAIFTPRNPFLVGAILSIAGWAGLARQLRSQVLTIREEDYIEAARSTGMSTSTIVGQEIMPKLAPFILISGASAAAGVIAASVALYFIGVLPFSTNNWGVMLHFAYSQGDAVSNPGRTGHWLAAPLVALAGLTFALTLFSQGLDRVFNPRLRARHARTITDESDQGP